ncbi:1,2-phenylacetyl-CoA epoxidase subunit PaaB [Nakamurella sp. GG22]
MSGSNLSAEGGHGAVPTSGVPVPEPVPHKRVRTSRRGWPLWEVFVRARRGLSHQHVGSLHAPDAAMALRNARDVYTRRGEGVSIWVVPSTAIAASSPDEKDPFFDPALDKAYRHPTFYEVPDGVAHL